MINQTPSFPSTPTKRPLDSFCHEIDSDFKEYRYSEKVPYCQRNVPYRKRSEVYDIYNIPRNQRRHYTIDHIIPLAIGGDNSLENIWPENKKIKRMRYNLEIDTYLALKKGCLNRSQASSIILNNKFDKNLFRKPIYKAYGGLINYLFSRETSIFHELDLKKCRKK